MIPPFALLKFANDSRGKCYNVTDLRTSASGTYKYFHNIYYQSFAILQHLLQSRHDDQNTIFRGAQSKFHSNDYHSLSYSMIS